MFSCVQLSTALWTVAHKAPLFMEFSKWEYWSGMPFPTPGDLLDPRIEPESHESPALAGGFFTTSATRQLANWHLKRYPTLLVIWEMQIKTMRSHLTLVKMAIIKKSTENKCWRGCGEKGIFLHCWWECKLVQPLRKTAWSCLPFRRKTMIKQKIKLGNLHNFK